jgi:hypothetical protein
VERGRKMKEEGGTTDRRKKVKGEGKEKAEEKTKKRRKE